jgi:hypothetical protein
LPGAMIATLGFIANPPAIGACVFGAAAPCLLVDD